MGRAHKCFCFVAEAAAEMALLLLSSALLLQKCERLSSAHRAAHPLWE